MLSRDQAKQITDKVLAMSKADEAFVSLSGEQVTHIRFARNSPSTSGSYDQPVLSIRSTFGKRSGTARANQFDDASLAEAVRRSEELARLAPEDPEHMPALEPQTYPEVKAFFGAGDDGAVTLARGVSTCLKDAERRGVVAAGFSRMEEGFSCIANSRGLFGYHQASGAFVSETARTRDATGSGWSSTAANRAADLDYARVSQTAIDKALASVEAKPLDPGTYVTILEPACVASLLQILTWSMSARSADEGRSYFSAPGGGNRLGEKLFGDDITIYSDPQAPEAPGAPWGADGLPQARRPWIDKGTVANLSYDRYWAAKTGKPAVPGGSNTIMTGGTASLADLIASTERGVLVTSLWYIRSVDPRTLLHTGLTRDGVFLIENGAIKHPVHNFRWNDSPIAVLKNVVAMSRPERVPPRPSHSTTTVVPALKVKEFTFSSVSEAV